MEIVNGGVCAAKGFVANGIHCGVRKNKVKKDLSLIVSEKVASCAGNRVARGVRKVSRGD